MQEIIVISVATSANKSVLFVLCYRSPSSDVNDFVNSLNTLLSNVIGKYSHICLLGDFNFPGIQWNDSLYFSNCPVENSFVELIDDFGFKQLNSHPSTVHGNILDLVLVNFESLSEVCVKQCELTSDHKVLDFVIKCETIRVKIKRQWVYNYKAMDVNSVKSKLNDADLCSVINNASSVNDSWIQWSETVKAIIDEYVPKVQLNDTHEVAWFDKDVRHLRNKKATAWRKAKRLNRLQDWRKFRKIRNSFNILLKRKYKKFIGELGFSVKQNPKKFCTFIKSKTGSRSVPTLVTWKTITADSPDTQANLFNDYFFSVFTKEDTCSYCTYTNPGSKLNVMCKSNDILCRLCPNN